MGSEMCIRDSIFEDAASGHYHEYWWYELGRYEHEGGIGHPGRTDGGVQLPDELGASFRDDGERVLYWHKPFGGSDGWRHHCGQFHCIILVRDVDGHDFQERQYRDGKDDSFCSCDPLVVRHLCLQHGDWAANDVVQPSGWRLFIGSVARVVPTAFDDLYGCSDVSEGHRFFYLGKEEAASKFSGTGNSGSGDSEDFCSVTWTGCSSGTADDGRGRPLI